ncbi:DUF1254 domain-containing protein [Cupriavidus pinatubonensis]|uniref:DUF1254 domain-containing protein n=1 Tax=Cupriavidus pinatubonensis TaxID=248026 RepID=A0ABN7YN28_9BURK|nr:DUF1254 domain-containing protein [Cupriavidus pinatubonensis]CAG9174887.1 hypothetical protein LMG23994_02981 [Cupriavidus pinatubonensis]
MNAPRTPASDQAALLRDAVVYTYPLYEMARMRAATCPRRRTDGTFAGGTPDTTLRWVNQLFHSRSLLGPQHRQVVTPNNDTLYTNAWLDLSKGPVCISVPDTAGRYYVLGLLDAYTNPFGGIGSRTTGTGAGRYLLHGPRWQGEIPSGMQAVPCPTHAIWMIGRWLVDGEADLPAVHRLQDAVGLTRADGTPAAHAFDVSMQPGERAGDPVRFAAVVNHMLRDNPPPAEQAAYVARFAAVGIGADCDAGTMDDAQRNALSAALAALDAELAAPIPSDLGGGWSLPVELLSTFGERYLERALVARNYIGALGMEEAMYLIADCDGEGQPLDGRASYELVFPADGLPQVDAFWSLTLYRKSDCMLVENPLCRYSLGDRSPAPQYESDGSLRLLLGSRAPAAASLQGNWLPAPDEPFYVALRLYVPRKAHLDKTFAYPPIRRVGA